ncbi:MAG TPA: 2-amino-4-hydroxy-6-hydroxymethyldihydropteridine diphosphokinase [Burkholderiaceae bacterium]
MIDAYVGIGANLGDARATVEAALGKLAELPQSKLVAQSSLFASAPIDAGGDDYVNAVAHLKTGLPAEALLQQLQAIELEFGRERPYRNAPRTLDLDILLYGANKISSATLTVPHPRLTERAFALIPLLQLDPFVKIPGKGAAHSFAPAVANQRVSRLSE